MARDCAIIRQDTQEKPESERVAEGPRHEKRDGPGDGSTGRTRQSGSPAPLWSLCSDLPSTVLGSWTRELGREQQTQRAGWGQGCRRAAGRETAQRAGRPPAAHPHPWSMLPATRIVNKAGVCRLGCPGQTGGAEWFIRASLIAEGRSQQPNVRGATAPATNGLGGWVRIRRGLSSAFELRMPVITYCPDAYRIQNTREYSQSSVVFVISPDGAVPLWRCAISAVVDLE